MRRTIGLELRATSMAIPAPRPIAPPIAANRIVSGTQLEPPLSRCRWQRVAAKAPSAAAPITAPINAPFRSESRAAARCGRGPPTQTPSPETARCSIGPTVAGGRAAPALGMLTAAASGADRWAKRDVGIVVTLNITRTEYPTRRTLQLRSTIPSAGLAAVVSLSFCGIKRAAVTGAAAAGRPVEDDAAARDPVRQKYEREPDAASVG